MKSWTKFFQHVSTLYWLMFVMFKNQKGCFTLLTECNGNSASELDIFNCNLLYTFSKIGFKTLFGSWIGYLMYAIIKVYVQSVYVTRPDFFLENERIPHFSWNSYRQTRTLPHMLNNLSRFIVEICTTIYRKWTF